MTMPEFKYQDPFPLAKDTTKYYKIPGSEKYVSVAQFEGKEVVKVAPEALTVLANQAMKDVSFLLRPEHNEQVAKILSDRPPLYGGANRELLHVT
jgi:fumarate hydratase class I